MTKRIGVSSNNRAYMLTLFFFVYLVEEIVYIVTLSYFPMVFKMMGLNPLMYGIFSGVALLPIAFKMFIGPLSDKFPIRFLRGKRRGYFILGAILNIILLPFLSLSPVDFLALFFIIWFFQTLGIATMDIMNDTLSVQSDTFKSGSGRTMSSVFMFLGTFVGGYITTLFIPVLMSDLRFGLICFSGISIIPLGLVIFLRELNGRKAENSNGVSTDLDDPPTASGDPSIASGNSTPSLDKVSLWAALKQNLGRDFIKWGLVFAFVLDIDGGLLELTLSPFLFTTFGIPMNKVVSDLFYISMLGYVLAFAGYFFIDSIKKNKLLILICIIYIPPMLILGTTIFLNLLTYNLFLWMYGIFALVSGLSYITYIGLFLELSDPKSAGLMLALFYTVTDLGSIMGIMISGFFTMWLIYFISAGITAFRIIPLLKIKMAKIEETFYPAPKRKFTWKDAVIGIIPIAILVVVFLVHYVFKIA